MAVWIIGDTHLSLNGSKPMDIFGSSWADHAERLAAHWRAVVAPADAVIIAGDISWALQTEEALPDLRFLHELPGRRKILLRGNHDYWWSTRAKVSRALAEAGLDTLQLFQNEALLLPEADEGPLLLIGTRGWSLPGDDGFTADDEKVLRREVLRLELSVRAAEALCRAEQQNYPRIAVMHYPPLGRDGRASDFSRLLEKSGARRCYYGHVHGPGGKLSFSGEKNGIVYQNIAGDQVDFCPQRVTEA